MAKTVEEKYKKYELLEHILALPDTYIGSIEPQKINTYVFNNETKKMEEKELSYIPGLLKIFDEVIVNAIDHSMRLKAEEATGKEDIKHLKNIKVSINKETGYITVFNDGNGVDIKKHATYGDLWIPELIFGELLTSTNYDKNEEKIWGGKNGYGSKLTNIFSKEFTIETVDHYSKKIFTQTFRNNMTEREQPTVKACTKLPYTQITFLPDYERFGMKGLSDNMYELFHRRVIDACATTSKDVSVFLNTEKLAIKDFEKYCELFLDKKEQPSVYEACGERWEVVASISKSGSYEQLSFVNGINTIRGGKHIEYITNMITKNLVDMALAKKKKAIKAQHIKDNLFVFAKALIVNPSFDSQSKETLTTPVAKFGSKCELSDKFYDKLFKQVILLFILIVF
jgi:DNA topoisomerase-2